MTVVDNGRGIPVGPHPTVIGMDAAEVVLTKLHAGGKFDKGAYKVSGGLHGVGVSVVNALSERLEVEIWRDKKVYRQFYARGIPMGKLENVGVTDRRGTKITFKPDSTIFETTTFSFDTLSQRLRELSFLNRGILITLEDERDGKKNTFQYQGGIASFVEHLNRNKATLHPTPIMIEGTRDGVLVEIALQWNDGYAENIYSFANNINTHDGGTHLIGLQGRAHPQPERLRPEHQPHQGNRARSRARTPARACARWSASRSRTRSSKARPRASSATPR